MGLAHLPKKTTSEDVASWANLAIVGTEFQYQKMVVLLEIPCAEKQPVQFAGVEYIRIGSNKKNLKEYPDKERELWRTFDSTPYELRIAIVRNDAGKWNITNMGALMIAKDLKRFESLHRRSVRVIWYKEKSRLNAIREKEFTGGYAFSHEDIVQYIMAIIPQEEIIVEATRKSVISLQKRCYLQRYHLI